MPNSLKKLQKYRPVVIQNHMYVTPQIYGYFLGLEEIDQIWIPQLIFTNSLEQTFLFVDGSSSLTIQREGDPYFPPSDDLAENLYYYGSENPLLYNDSYELTFHCQFELENYPFDNQQCSILVNSFKE